MFSQNKRELPTAALQCKKAEKTGLASGGICDLIIDCFLFGAKSGFANWGRGREEKKVGVRSVGSDHTYQAGHVCRTHRLYISCVVTTPVSTRLQDSDYIYAVS